MTFIDRGQLYSRLAIIGTTIWLSACAGSPPSNLGMQSGKLAPCPSSPNCVSSYASDEDHAVSPWSFDGSVTQAQSKLEQILQATDNATLVTSESGYIRAEFESSLMGFVDDVEFVIEKGVVNMRSASRLGYSDLGVNRERIATLEKAFKPCCK